MAKKKYSSIFTISIDPHTLQGIRAINMLNMVGERKKAALIVEALNFYNEQTGIYDMTGIIPIPKGSELEIVATTSTKKKNNNPKETVNEDPKAIVLPVDEEDYANVVETINEDGFIDEEDYVDDSDDTEAFSDAMETWGNV